ncbi:MAG: helix-turn-helix domain-containing protein [Mycobacterium sp.]|nr:helix-turn-helix domain-containing protein [Mycobacterium sp.]
MVNKIATVTNGVVQSIPQIDTTTKPVPSTTQQLVAVCRADVAKLTRLLMTAVFTDNPEWTDYSAVTEEDLREGCRNFLTRVLDLLDTNGSGAERDDVAAAIGKHRAEQGVPLEAMLRTFRLGGRIIWEALSTQTTIMSPTGILETGTAMWAVIDGMSCALVTSYRRTELDQVRRDERRRHALIEDLLAGRAHDALFATQAARELNIPVNAHYLVVVAEGDSHPILLGTETALAGSGVRSVWHDRVTSTVGIVALESHSPEQVSAILRPFVRGRAAASSAVTGMAEIETAYALASLTLESIPDNTSRTLISLDERYLETLLMRSPDLAGLLITHALGPILALPDKEREILLQTLEVWLAQSCSAANAAPLLHCHRNTVINRLQRAAALLGHSLEGRRHVLELSLALTALQLRDSPQA